MFILYNHTKSVILFLCNSFNADVTLFATNVLLCYFLRICSDHCDILDFAHWKESHGPIPAWTYSMASYRKFTWLANSTWFLGITISYCPAEFSGNRDAPAPYERFVEWSKKYGNIITVWLGSSPIIVVNSYQLNYEASIVSRNSFIGRSDTILSKFFNSSSQYF